MLLFMVEDHDDDANDYTDDDDDIEMNNNITGIMLNNECNARALVY